MNDSQTLRRKCMGVFFSVILVLNIVGLIVIPGTSNTNTSLYSSCQSGTVQKVGQKWMNAGRFVDKTFRIRRFVDKC